MSLIPIEKWREKLAWESYWNSITDSGESEDLHVEESYLPISPLFGFGFAREAFLDGLYERRRILFLGNGIDREPISYYFSGFDVTVLDISETACQLFSRIKTDVSKNVHSFLSNISTFSKSSRDEDASMSRKFIYRSGGSLEIVCADMFEWETQSRFHYIHNKLAFLNFTQKDQELLLRHYYKWLKEGGHLQISYHSALNHPFQRIANTAKKIGFIVRDEDANEAFKEFRNLRDDPERARKFWLEYTRRELDKDFLVVKGTKMLWIMFGSSLNWM